MPQNDWEKSNLPGEQLLNMNPLKDLLDLGIKMQKTSESNQKTARGEMYESYEYIIYIIYSINKHPGY